jgi:rubrerythrin
MIGHNRYKASPFLLDKINSICSLLRQGKKEYEQVATTIEDKDLRCTILTLAQESNQYACELFSQIHTLGGTPEMEKNDDDELSDEIKNLYDEDEILTFCKMNEKKMVGAYQEILNESFLYEGLRKMIRYQLNQLLCNFMQVKQLASLKFH